MLRLGFIVEGNSDRVVVEWIARELLPLETHIRTVRLGSHAALPSAYTSVLTFVSKGYDQVVLVYDSDTTLPDAVSEQQRTAELSLNEHGLLDRVSVCPAVPEIEAWLVAGIAELDPTVADPKELLRRFLGPSFFSGVDMDRLAAAFDVSLARRRSPSFSQFVEAIEQAGALSTTGSTSSPS